MGYATGYVDIINYVKKWIIEQISFYVKCIFYCTFIILLCANKETGMQYDFIIVSK